MVADTKDSRSIDLLTDGLALAAFVATLVVIPGLPARSQTGSELALPMPESESTEPGAHMSEGLRSSVRKVVVIAGEVPARDAVSGTYDKQTAGLVGGMSDGRRLGTITKEVGGVPVNIPIPILTIPGMVYGGLSGAAKRRIQEFRDELTEELVKAESRALTNEGLALDVYSGLRRLSDLDANLFASTTPIPDDTDAVLYASFDGVAIDVQGDEAIITTSAKATLRRLSDGADLYQTVIHYQDRDTLGNWTKNENALWRDYANFARHYLGREISAAMFDRLELRQEWQLLKTDNTAGDRKNERHLVSRALSPTLAWDLKVSGDDANAAWAGGSDTYYDVEVYDLHRLVYAEQGVPEPRHTIAIALDDCETYRWSVRPSFRSGGKIKFGAWMRFDPDTKNDADEEAGAEIVNGIVGRQASEAPAYIQDFPLLTVKCGSK